MQARPWSSEPPLRCVHTGQPPKPMNARDAFETFERCLKQHVFPDAVSAITELENKLANVKERISKLREEEVDKLDAIQERFRRISEIIHGAQAALRPLSEGREEPDESQADANVAQVQEKDADGAQ